MRKYAIPKTFYAIVIALILSLSIGYTYAYFSAYKTAEGKAKVHKIEVSWHNTQLPGDIANGTTIQVSSKLKRGGCSDILDADSSAISLAMYNSSEIDVYCRVKLEATYTSTTKTNEPCSQWIKLAQGETTSEYTLLENDSTWVYLNGYYYYGTEDTSTNDKDSGGIGVIPAPISNGDITPVANLLYLDGASSADIYGATVTITLTLESVQSANEAYKTWWKSTT